MDKKITNNYINYYYTNTKIQIMKPERQIQNIVLEEEESLDYVVYRTRDMGYKITDSYKSINSKLNDTNDVVVVIDCLQTLYDSIGELEQNRYTDNYTGTFDIRIGKKVSMDPSEAEWSTADCARQGLHFAGNTASYVLRGDTTVLVLINPMKVVGIGTKKGRCYEYLPFMISSIDEANNIMENEEFDFNTLDEEYAIEELSMLEDKVKNGFSKEAKKYNFNFPNLSSSDISNIVDFLNDIEKKIKDRVVNIE